MNDQIEIRLLGRLWIRLGNGSVVPSSRWTTGKTSDLLRILAMSSGQVVTSTSLIEKLWPDVPPAKGAASLHTATAQIRKILGKDSVMRHVSGLQLRNCWVDAVTHHELAADISGFIRTRDYSAVVNAAKQAEALYVDDFHAHDDESEWASSMRDQLRARRKLMLGDAADCAVELGWMRDAIELSTLAISLDSCFERAHRSLMRAYAGIGEVDSAVRSYERCRRNLATHLGVPPSPQTEALKLQLGSGDAERSTFSTYVGREKTLDELSEAIRQSSHGDGTAMVCVVGLPGSGRESLLAAAVDRLPGTHLRAVRPPKVARQAPATRLSSSAGMVDAAVLGPLDLSPARAMAVIHEVLATIPPQSGRVLVVVTTPETGALMKETKLPDYVASLIDSAAMDVAELTQLAEVVLAGSPSPDLVDTLMSRSEGLAGISTQILRAWVANGQIISTLRGLGLVSDSLTSTVMPAASTTFKVLAEQLAPADIEICQVMAVIDRPASAADIMEILGSERRTENRRIEIEARMHHLTSRGILTSAGTEYAFRDRTTQDLFELWLRPSLQVRIRQRIHEQAENHPIAQ